MIEGGVRRVLSQNARNVVRGSGGGGYEQQHREEHSPGGGYRPDLHWGSRS